MGASLRRAAVLGSPIAHSLSPVLHTAAYRALGLDWRYEAVEVTEAQLPDFIASCDQSWAGLSLTMPLKLAVLPLLDEVSELATATQAVNTVVFDDSTGVRRRRGFNTDVQGLKWALTSHGVPANPSALTDRTVALLGAGATTRSAIEAVAQLGSRSVTVSARRPEAVDELARVAAHAGIELVNEAWERADELLVSDLVISTLPAHACDRLAVDVPKEPGLLLDVVYSPWPTDLARSWRDQGGTAISGLEMLVGQAAEQVRLMTGLAAPVEQMLAAGRAALRNHSN